MAKKKTRSQFKNKQEISSISGKRSLPKPKTGTKVIFKFITKDGTVYENGTGRIKIATDGGISCLINDEKGWLPVKAELTNIKIVKYVKPKMVVQRARNRKPSR